MVEIGKGMKEAVPLSQFWEMQENRTPTSGNLDHENVKICAKKDFQTMTAAKDNSRIRNYNAPISQAAEIVFEY